MTGGLRPLRAAVATWKPGRGIAGEPLHEIAAGWAGIVGADVAAHCWPLELAGTTLVVATKSSAWSQQLSFLSATILGGVHELPHGRAIERLAFRAGALRPGVPARARTPAAGRPRRRTAPASAPEPPAADLQGAFERLRDRMRAAHSVAPAGSRCEGCGAAVEPVGEAGGARRCAPCVGRASVEAGLELERILYMAPWLTHAELREQLPALSGSEFEHARRRLLQRWWLVLERARRAGRVSSPGMEREVASSYVLLESRLPPDRISPAVVRNLLGDELDALLWPRDTQPSAWGNPALSSNRTD
jgi:hypothetical protein